MQGIMILTIVNYKITTIIMGIFPYVHLIPIKSNKYQS